MPESSLVNAGRPFLFKQHPDVGLSRTAFVDAVRDGAVVKLLPRVYVDARARETRELRVAAARLVVPAHAVVCDETAAWVWGVDVDRPGDRHTLEPRWVVPHGLSRTRLEGVGCRQALVPDDDVERVGDLLVTTPVRTTSDLLRTRWRPYAMAAADAMAHAGLVRPREVQEFVARLKGYRGIRQARSLAQQVEPLAESPGESWTRLRLTDAGLPRPQAQAECVDAGGTTRRLDLAYVERMLAVEYDGRRFHTADDDVEHDDDRRRLLEATGLRFVVVRRNDVLGDDDAFEREVGRLLGITPLRRWW